MRQDNRYELVKRAYQAKKLRQYLTDVYLSLEASGQYLKPLLVKQRWRTFANPREFADYQFNSFEEFCQRYLHCSVDWLLNVYSDDAKLVAAIKRQCKAKAKPKRQRVRLS